MSLLTFALRKVIGRVLVRRVVPGLWVGGAALLLLGLRKRLARRVEWQNRRVVIMGGSRGLGLLLASEFLQRGARVMVAARSELELTEARDAFVLQAGIDSDQLFAIPCNVENREDVERTIAMARERLGGIDVLVNVAGIIQVGPLESMRIEDFEQAMRVHFSGPLVATLAVLDEMRARRSGHIVNIVSIGGLVTIPHLLPYVASKFALTGLSLGLGVELAQAGIRVTTVCPGLMRTGSSYRADFKSQHRLEHSWFALGAASPLTSMSAPRAARRILRAIERNEAFLVLSWQARLLAKANALAPRLMLRLLGLVARALPRFGGIGQNSRSGFESTSRWVPSAFTRLNDRAALVYGELAAPAGDRLG